MSVLVPSLINSHSHYFPHHRINGHLSQSTKHMSFILEKSPDMTNDQVPFGVVNSMKQRLLDKVNEALLLNSRYSLTKLSNENLLQTKSLLSPLKKTARLSRSQENLLNNNTEQFLSYLQPKQDLIIVDTTANEENISTQRHAYTELQVDEVPKPGTVTTVKNMFERQIRLSRYDSDKVSHTSIPAHSRVNNQHREIPSPNRSRSISPNDMALRQRRTAAIPTSTSYPDLVISHTPPPTETKQILNEESVMNTDKDESKIRSNNQHRKNLLQSSTSSSDTEDYQPLDFKSRLALFNRTNTIERSNKHLHIPSNMEKPSKHLPSVPSPANFLTKPVVHRHQSEKKGRSFDQILNTTKSITFFGGTKTNENTKSNPPLPSIVTDENSNDTLRVPDIIGGNVKLNKSSISSGMKKTTRVQFLDNVNTFEYPSIHIAMSEYESTDSDDDDNDDDKNSVDDDELDQLARTNAKFNSNHLTEKPLEPKGSLHTFRPTHLDQYELGVHHDSPSSDTFSREKYFSLSENFSTHSILKQDLTNNIQWSTMSTITDLLF